MIVKTESGSLYELDLAKKTWARLVATENSGHLRTAEGTFNNEPAIEIGQPVVLMCDPITPGTGGRMIRTTLVVGITEHR